MPPKPSFASTVTISPKAPSTSNGVVSKGIQINQPWKDLVAVQTPFSLFDSNLFVPGNEGSCSEKKKERKKEEEEEEEEEEEVI